MNKKGFSLIELLIVFSILGILSAIFVTSLLSSSSASDEKADEAAIANLETTLQMAVQHNSIYKDAKKIAEDTIEDKILVVYTVDENNILLLHHCEAEDEDEGLSTNQTENKTGQELAKFQNKIMAYINGKMEPIELQSDYYQNQTYEITITFPDVDFRAETTVTMNSNQ